MPGPEEQANTYYCWGHGTTAEGLVGILTVGRVLRSSAEAVQAAPHDDVFPFYGKATQDVYYEKSKLDFISKLHQHQKQCRSCRWWVYGFWGIPNTKANLPARSMRATCANFMDLSTHHRVTNAWLSEKLPVASTAFGFDPNA